METFLSRAREAVKSGVAKDQFAAAVKTDDLGWMFNPNALGGLYDELKKSSGAQ